MIRFSKSFLKNCVSLQKPPNDFDVILSKYLNILNHFKLDFETSKVSVRRRNKIYKMAQQLTLAHEGIFHLNDDIATLTKVDPNKSNGKIRVPQPNDVNQVIQSAQEAHSQNVNSIVDGTLSQDVKSTVDRSLEGRDAAEGEDVDEENYTNEITRVPSEELFYILFVYRFDPSKGYSIFRELYDNQMCSVDENVIRLLFRFYTGNEETWRERFITWRDIMSRENIQWTQAIVNEALFILSKYDIMEAIASFNEFFFIPTKDNDKVPEGMMVPSIDSFLAVMKGAASIGYSTICLTLMKSFQRITSFQNDEDANVNMYSLLIQSYCRSNDMDTAHSLFLLHFDTTLLESKGKLIAPRFLFNELISGWKRQGNIENVSRLILERDALAPEKSHHRNQDVEFDRDTL